MTDQRTTPLYERHVEAGASFTDFGGWLMPVRYGSDTAEHHAVRENAGLFDISHMGVFVVRALDFLDFALASKVTGLEINQAKYTMVLQEDGGIIDDIIVYRQRHDSFLIIANAGNADAVDAALEAALKRFVPTVPASEDGSFAFVAGARGTVENISAAYALLALQGPNAAGILARVQGIDFTAAALRLGEADEPWHLDDLKNYWSNRATFNGETLMIARTGYTGEDGFELLVRADQAVSLWDAILEAGAADELRPAGLGARDSLRLEAGMPLYGHELSREITPAQVRLGRVVTRRDRDFVGKLGLEERDVSDARVLVGLVSHGRRAGRAGYAVVDDHGTVVGEVTSGTLSPTLGHPIAMAMVDLRFSEVGTEIFIDVRGTNLAATVTKLPFYRRTK